MSPGEGQTSSHQDLHDAQIRLMQGDLSATDMDEDTRLALEIARQEYLEDAQSLPPQALRGGWNPTSGDSKPSANDAFPCSHGESSGPQFNYGFEHYAHPVNEHQDFTPFSQSELDRAQARESYQNPQIQALRTDWGMSRQAVNLQVALLEVSQRVENELVAIRSRAEAEKAEVNNRFDAWEKQSLGGKRGKLVTLVPVARMKKLQQVDDKYEAVYDKFEAEMVRLIHEKAAMKTG